MKDIYHKEWFSKQAFITKIEKDYLKIDYGCMGKGDVYYFLICKGMQIVIVDVDTDDLIFTQTYDHDVLWLTYTLEGRYECEFANHQIVYIPEGYFSICSSKYLPISTSFPLNSCKTVSLVIEQDHLDQSFVDAVFELSLDIKHLGKHLDLDKNWYLSKASNSMRQLFIDIYQGIDIHNLNYYKIKALEICYYLEQLCQNHGCSFQYFDKGKIQIVKKIHDRMIEDLENRISLVQLINENSISMTVFKMIFKQIYGETPYNYLKKYKMNIAAKQLKETDKNISDIALSLGYANPSKFSAAFTAVYGILPKEYRKRK